jgi:hypothetical protein
MSNASPWLGLGSLKSSGTTQPAAAPGADDDEDDAFARPSVQRTVSAATAPSVVPLHAVASAFAHPFPAGTGSPDEDADQQPAATHHEEKIMPKTPVPAKPRKSRPTKGISARFQICALLLSKGDLSTEELKADVSAEPRAFQNAIYNAKGARHITFSASADKWHLTSEGKDWTSGGANLDNHRAAPAPSPTRKAATPAQAKRAKPGQRIKKAPRTVKTAAAEPSFATTVATRPFEPVIERSFRCAVFSDGGFFLAKGDQKIELTAAEHSEMLRYQERMCEQPTA